MATDNRISILIVDDEEDARRQIRRYLELEFPDYVFGEAENGKEALTCCENQPYQVIISDINMPKMDGIDLLKELKVRDSLKQVIFVTGRKDLDAAKEALRLGAADYLEKPLKMEEVVASINKGVERWERGTEARKLNERLEEEKRALQRQLVHSQKMEALGAFAGGIAHDFNNILAIIIGYSDMTAESFSEGSKERQNIKQVLAACERARRLIKQVLTFSRKSHEDRRPISLLGVINESQEFVSATLSPNIKVSFDLPQTHPEISGNATQIYQTLINLYANAAHAMRLHGGELAISLKSEEIEDALARTLGLAPGRYSLIVVADTGEGIQKESLNRIFEPLFTTKEVNEGTGMGLAVTHGIVSNHGGAIAVASEEGKGTTMTIYLPEIESAILSAEGESEKSDGPVQGTESILFVDDEKDLCDLNSQALSQCGFKVTTSHDGRSALEVFKEDPFNYDLVITDQTMPTLSGLDLARQIAQIRPDLPIMLVSGFRDLITNDQEALEPIDTYHCKPVSWRRLAQSARRILDNRKGDKEARDEGIRVAY